jgi:hypothetical protein
MHVVTFISNLTLIVTFLSDYFLYVYLVILFVTCVFSDQFAKGVCQVHVLLMSCYFNHVGNAMPCVSYIVLNLVWARLSVFTSKIFSYLLKKIWKVHLTRRNLRKIYLHDWKISRNNWYKKKASLKYKIVTKEEKRYWLNVCLLLNVYRKIFHAYSGRDKPTLVISFVTCVFSDQFAKGVCQVHVLLMSCYFNHVGNAMPCVSYIVLNLVWALVECLFVA